MNKGEVKKIIRDSLGLDENLNEAYVAQPKIYDLNTEMILTKTKEAHKELYNGYVENFNALSAEMDIADRMSANINSQYRNVKINEQYMINAVYLHELYFSNISDPYSEIGMDSFAHMRLNRDFGTFNDWQRDFIACGMSAKNGGWVVTAFSTYLKRYINFIVDGHDCHVPVGAYPVIVLDMWEHARRDYLNNKKDYIVAMMKELNWNVIEHRFKRADLINQAISGEGQGWL
jgi:Fe-Mn family superoxide dismutase